jgi:hypothetical protein
MCSMAVTIPDSAMAPAPANRVELSEIAEYVA